MVYSEGINLQGKQGCTLYYCRYGKTSLQEPEQELPHFEIQHVINIVSSYWGGCNTTKGD